MSNQIRSQINIEYTLIQSLDDIRRDVFLNLKCHDIATVKAVDVSNQTLTAEINYKRTMLRPNTSKTSPENRERFDYVPRQEEYPLLIDVPFIVMQGGGAYLNIPIKVGDQCLLLYNDRCIDDWFLSGKRSVLSSSRLHSMADALALVGISSMANLIQGYDADRIGFRDGESKVMVGDKIEISNAAGSLAPILENLLTALSTMLQTMSTASTLPDVAGKIAASAALAKPLVDQAKTDLGQLLE